MRSGKIKYDYLDHICQSNWKTFNVNEKKKETEKSVETVDLGGNMIYLSLSMLKFREKHKIQEEQSYRQLRDYEEVLTYWEKRE